MEKINEFVVNLSELVREVTELLEVADRVTLRLNDLEILRRLDAPNHCKKMDRKERTPSKEHEEQKGQ